MLSKHNLKCLLKCLIFQTLQAPNPLCDKAFRLFTVKKVKCLIFQTLQALALLPQGLREL